MLRVIQSDDAATREIRFDVPNARAMTVLSHRRGRSRHAKQMFSVPDHSLVLLINPDIACRTELPDEIKTRLENSCNLLRQTLRAAAVPARLLGAAEVTGASFAAIANCEIIPNDPVNLWRDQDAIDRLGHPETQVLYLGGAWLEEEVLIAALSAARIGYDTRVFTDVSVLRSLLDRTPALDRLAQHGILTTTVRQTVMEWSLSAANEDLARRLRTMLDQ
jgi:hypothetical protein